jgi:hypothetical protein
VQIDSLKTVAFTLIFLMPGFVWSAMLSVLVPGRSRESSFLGLFTLSCLNNSFWTWPFAYFFVTGLATRSPSLFAMFVFVAVFISPLLLGTISGRLAQREYMSHFLQRFGFRTIHSTPTAWDWHFSRQEELWARITIKDGSVIFGFFGSRSFASSNPDERDIYLEQVYTRTAEGVRCVESTRGCLVKGDQISAIEFYKIELE